MVEQPAGSAAPPPSPESPKSKIDELGPLGTVIVAVAGGIGVLGFVAFFGAAILWVRMDEAGLPGNDAVAIVPKSVLIATGASFLVPALLIALGFTAVLYVFDWLALFASEFPQRAEKRKLAAAKRKQRTAERRSEALEGVVESAEHNRDAAASAVEIAEEPATVKEDAEDLLRSVTAAAAAAATESVEAREERLRAERELQAKERESALRVHIEKVRTGIVIALTVGLFLLGLGSIFLLDGITLSTTYSVLLAAATMLLAVFCVVVRLRTRSFPWLAATVFFAVGLMIATLTYFRTLENPKVEPVALLRADGPPVWGFYIAQTGDRVYIGAPVDKQAVRLVEIPREEVVGLVVGNLQDADVAASRSLRYAVRLCRHVREREATGEVVGDKGGGVAGEELASGCTASDLRHLLAAGDGERRLAVD